MTVKDQTCVVIAAYNEAAMIARVVTEVRRAGYRVVVVDDGSKDTTAQAARAAGATVIQHPFNLGQGAALQSGIDLAFANGAEVIVTFDADGQHGAGDISRLVEPSLRTTPTSRWAAGFWKDHPTFLLCGACCSRRRPCSPASRLGFD